MMVPTVAVAPWWQHQRGAQHASQHHHHHHRACGNIIMAVIPCQHGLLHLLLLLLCTTTTALISPEPVSALLQTHGAQIQKFQALDPTASDIFCLRYCLADDPETAWATAMEWRTSSQGQLICQSAARAVAAATSGGGANWKNSVVLDAAPHAAAIGRYISSVNCITTTTTSTSTADLVYCIRAGAIDDVGLMSAVSVEEMVEFFMYTKEVNALVADQRSTDYLVSVVTCNDLSGVKLMGGSADFRKALSESSTLASTVYPSTAGPTLLVNLPKLLNALVKLFTPLFPPAVKERLKFSQGPLKGVEDLMVVASASKDPARAKFVQQLQELLP